MMVVGLIKRGKCEFWERSRSVTGAGEGNRTLVCSLGSYRSTIELHPHNANPRKG
jgi:hypothetical protein